MNKKLQSLVWIASLVCAGSASALDDAGIRYIDRMVKGGPDSLHDVAESMYRGGVTDPDVLDVAAEVLLEKYNRTAGSFDLNDAMAYLCKTLGASGNARYKPVLLEVGDKAENRKLRGYCEKAAKSFPKKTDVPGYVAGTINLEKLRQSQPSAPPPRAAANQNRRQAAAAATADFSAIREGMSSDEVADILGPPTSTSQHRTGKEFVPFNYGARDLERMFFIYKGAGRIEFSLKSAYNGIFRVIHINPDPNESGYP